MKLHGYWGSKSQGCSSELPIDDVEHYLPGYAAYYHHL